MSPNDPNIVPLREELEAVRGQMRTLLQKVQDLDQRLERLGQASPSVKPAEIRPVPPAAPVLQAVAPVSPPPAPVAKKGDTDVELKIGQFWLNKIGIVVFALGIVFLISYAFASFGAVMKIGLGYLIGAVLLGLGISMEKNEKLRHFGLVLLGGGWAILYFTTYAMSHFQNARLIDDERLGIILLGLVAVGMMGHTLRLRSESLLSVSLFVAYMTVTMGHITSFTFLSCAVLAAVALIVVHRMQWIRTLFLGILLTYTTHFFWVQRNIYSLSYERYDMIGGARPEAGMDLGFLALYWFIFSVGIHLLRGRGSPSLGNQLSGANVMNFLLFLMMSLGRVRQLYPDSLFECILGMGAAYLILALVSEARKDDKLALSDTVISISAITLALPLRFAPLTTDLLWLIEIPFLVFCGLYFERSVFRVLAMILSGMVFLKLVIIDIYAAEIFNLAGRAVGWKDFLTLCGFLSMAVSNYLARASAPAAKLSSVERGFSCGYAWLSYIYLTIFIGLVSDGPWTTPLLFLEALGFLVVNWWAPRMELRLFPLAVLSVAMARFCWVDNYLNIHGVSKWGFIVGQMILIYGIYLVHRAWRLANDAASKWSPVLDKVFFGMALVMWLAGVFQYFPSRWVTLCLGVAGAFMFAVGFTGGDKVSRVGGFILFAVTMLRVVFVELAYLETIYKIISFIVLGLLFLGVSFIYTKKAAGKEQG